MLLFLNHEHLAALLTNVFGVLPKLVLLPFGHPSLDQDVIRILLSSQRGERLRGLFW